jgi:hypothetical protein
MTMSNMVIFLSQFSLSLVLYWLLARYFFVDSAKNLPAEKQYALLLVPHGLRLLGMLALVPEVVGEPLAKTPVAAAVAYGDAAAALLAVVAMWLWLSGRPGAKMVTWLFSIVGSADLANAIFGALTLPVYNYNIGAFWIVLTYIVPLLVVTHVMIFVQLLSPSRSRQVSALQS